MAGKSTYLEQVVLDHIFGIASFSAPATVYIGLHKGDPTDAGSGGTEVSGGSYTRQAITNDGTGWTRSSSTVSNDAAIDFGTASADWATSGSEITHLTVWDASTSGNMLFSTAFVTPYIVLSGTPFSIAISQLQFTED